MLLSCSSNKNKKNNGTVTTTHPGDHYGSDRKRLQQDRLSQPVQPGGQRLLCGRTNEAAVCRILAQKTAAILEQSGVTVIVAGDNDSIQTKTAMGDRIWRRMWRSTPMPPAWNRLLLQRIFGSKQESGTGSV
ncbi:MAG: hypothetical protein ACLUOF_01260 [Ruminococcus sp.]